MRVPVRIYAATLITGLSFGLTVQACTDDTATTTTTERPTTTEETTTEETSTSSTVLDLDPVPDEQVPDPTPTLVPPVSVVLPQFTG